MNDPNALDACEWFTKEIEWAHTSRQQRTAQALKNLRDSNEMATVWKTLARRHSLLPKNPILEMNIQRNGGSHYGQIFAMEAQHALSFAFQEHEALADRIGRYSEAAKKARELSERISGTLDWDIFSFVSAEAYQSVLTLTGAVDSRDAAKARVESESQWCAANEDRPHNSWFGLPNFPRLSEALNQYAGMLDHYAKSATAENLMPRPNMANRQHAAFARKFCRDFMLREFGTPLYDTLATVTRVALGAPDYGDGYTRDQVRRHVKGVAVSR